MHLLIVNQYGLPSGAPGITRHGDLGAELVRRGHTVTVIASRFNYLKRQPEGRSGSTTVHDGVTFRWLDSGSYRTNDRNRVRSMIAFTGRAIAVGWRLSPRPDAVLASSPHLLTGVAGVVLSRRHRVPLLFEVRDLWPSALVDLGGVRPGGLTHRLLELLERRCYRAARRIVTVPPHADRRVAEAGGNPHRCVHIPNATSFRADRERPIPASLSRVFDACGERHILVYAGAQGVSNGLGVVFDALDVLRDQRPDVYRQLAVVLIGDGNDHEHLMHRARAGGHDHVHFHPPIDKDEVPGALRLGSLLLVSFADAPVYDYGLSPNKLFDYLAAERPVLLATRLTDTPVHEADAGRAFTPGSGPNLARAITELLQLGPDERQAMGQRGRRLVEGRFTIEATGAQLERLLRDVVGVPSRSA